MVCIRHSWAASCTACSAALRTSRWGQLPSCLSSHLSMQARDRVILRLFLHAPQPNPTLTVDFFFAKFWLLNSLFKVIWCLNHAANHSDMCCIFQPTVGCWAPQRLVEIVIFSVFCGKNSLFCIFF